MLCTELPHRGVLEIQGEDKTSFLQGLITNDVTLVSPESAIYAALLSPQGRFLFDFFIIERNGSYFLDAEKDRLESLLKKLNLYKLRSKVILRLRLDLAVFAMWEEGVAAHLGLSEEKGRAHDGVFMDPRLSKLGARAIGELPSKSFQSATPSDYDLHRLVLGVPEGGRDLIPEKAILLESGLDELNAISWTKGCYMGQELTARTKYRGLVRKRLFPVRIEGTIPTENVEIFSNGKEVGEMRTHNGSQGLALLRIEAVKNQEKFLWGEARLKPYSPVWMRLDEPS